MNLTTPSAPALDGDNRRGTHPDTHFSNGRILTMAGPTPEYVESLVISGGRIVHAGTSTDAVKDFPEAVRRDLSGATLLPGFIDAHSHFQASFEMVKNANVGPPPMGHCADIADVIAALAEHRDQHNIPAGEWLTGYGYDQEALREKRHITAAELDLHFPDHKVMLVHVSSHGVVLNSAALAWAGIGAETPAPAGGIIARVPGSQQPAGLLMETAYMNLLAPKLPVLTPQDRLALLDAAQQGYASQGYTHVNDGFASVTDLKMYQGAADAGLLYLDLAAVGSFAEAKGWLGNPDYPTGQYSNGFKIAGLKIFQDGSPQGRTAFMSEPYLTGGLDGQADWRGEPTMPFEVFASVVENSLRHGVQLHAHVNGDAAIDQLIQAVERTGTTAADDPRIMAIHSQFQRPDHLPQYLRLGITPSYFTNHTFFWGDVHRANVGEAKAAFISPMKSALEAGLVVSNHSDFPVTSVDPFFIMSTATRRTTRTGHILGPAERLTSYQALQALTTGPAHQLFEDSRKGMLQPGLLADLVMLDGDPLTVGAEELVNIKVLETIKEGRTVFSHP